MIIVSRSKYKTGGSILKSSILDHQLLKLYFSLIELQFKLLSSVKHMNS